jgi:hypothetical protein
VATLLGRPRENFCWGGGTAIRKKNFHDAHIMEAWDGAASDDFAMTMALREAGKSILFCPECLAPTVHPWTLSGVLEFTNRQIVITRVYSSQRWILGAVINLSYALTLIYAAVVVAMVMAADDPWIQPALVALVIPMLAAMKGALRTVAVSEALPEWKVQLNRSGWVWSTLAPVVPFLFSWNFVASFTTRRILWRGIRYELVTASETRILKR